MSEDIDLSYAYRVFIQTTTTGAHGNIIIYVENGNGLTTQKREIESTMQIFGLPIINIDIHFKSMSYIQYTYETHFSCNLRYNSYFMQSF